MTRGKYAARAAGVRAEKSEATVEQLRAQLAAERESHAEKARKLKAEIEHLSGQLTSAVGDLAEERVIQAQSDAIGLLAAAAAENHARLLEIFRLCGRHLETGVGYSYTDGQMRAFFGELITASGIEPGEAWTAMSTATPFAYPRKVRRQSKADNELLTQGVHSKSVMGRPRS